MISAGSRLGAYTVLDKLGQGGMGDLYRARDTALGRDLALTVLAAPVAGDGDRAARFTRETQTLAALNHPHIAQVSGVLNWFEEVKRRVGMR